MTEEEYVNDRLKMFSDEYDFYIEQKTFPEKQSEDIVGTGKDAVEEYVRSIMADIAADCGDNKERLESMKNAAMDMLSSLLRLLYQYEEEYAEEMGFLDGFMDASMDDKRAMWHDVVKTIKDKYSHTAINIDGYSAMFAGHNADDVFKAIENDWRKAASEHKYQGQMAVINSDKNANGHKIYMWGDSDYNTKRKLNDVFFRYPQLKEIVDMIGRDKENSNEEQDCVKTSFKDKKSKRLKASAEAETVGIGDNVQYMLPTEMAIMGSRETEMLFYQRYAAKQLQVYSSHPVDEQKKKTQENTKTPRMDKGPIIVSVDTSGSMCGRPTDIANSILLQLVSMAKKQNRPCFLITYSVNAQCIDLALPGNYDKLSSFLEDGYTGGTDGEEMMRMALDALNTDTYSMADILIISDFEFDKLKPDTMKRVEAERALGTRFYGLCIGMREYNQLDKLWHITSSHIRTMRWQF